MAYAMAGIAAAQVATGIAGIFESRKARKEQARMQEKALELQRQQLAFQQAQYANWQSVYGSIQDNLSNYFNSMSADSRARQNITMLEQEYNRASEVLNANLASRGMAGSGAAVLGTTQLEQSRAVNRVNARLEAEDYVTNAKMQFLNLGLGQQAQLQNNISNTYSNMAQTMLGFAGNKGDQASGAASGGGSMIGQGLGTLGQAIGMYAGSTGGTGTSTVSNGLGTASSSGTSTFYDSFRS